MAFVIKHPNGTYFEKWVPIGPKFGATLDKAKRFETNSEAMGQTGIVATAETAAGIRLMGERP